MKLHHCVLVIAAAAALTVAGCAEIAHKPPIGKTLGGENRPNAKILPIKPSKPVTKNRAKAIANYKALLKLDPGTAIRNEAQRRVADLQVETQDIEGNPTSGHATLEKSIDTYRKLIADHPNGPDNDRLLYQLARAYENSGDWKKAVATLKHMESRYPDSVLMSDAHFRSGEILYRHRQYANAAKQYRIVIGLGKDTPLYQTAQYKYGWSLFKQQKYTAAITTFLKILDADLPSGTLSDPDTALAKVKKGNADIAKDSLRVVSLSFTALGGGQAINEYLEKHTQPAYYELIYNALGNRLLKHDRYTDAANTYAAFIKKYPDHPDAPGFQDKVIAAYKDGGFNDLVLTATEQYAETYAPDRSYWKGKQPTDEVMAHLHDDLIALGRHYEAKGDRFAKAEKGKAATGKKGSNKAGQHNQGQEKPADAKRTAARDKAFATAAHWYRRFQTIFPTSKDAAQVSMSLGDSLYDGGQLRDAGWAYEKTAYAYPHFKKAPDAALAAVQTWQKAASQASSSSQRDDALKMSIRSSKKLIEVFPEHPKRNLVLAETGVNLLQLKRYSEAVKTSQKVLAAQPAAKENLQREALGVIGDARFKQKNYPGAEQAYTKMLKITPAENGQHGRVVTQLAQSIYRQGEQQQKLGNLRVAAENFLRVGKVVPEAKLHAVSDYNAAADFIKLKDWPNAVHTLTSFRKKFPDNKLIPKVDEKLAVSYQSSNKPGKAAAVYQRIANRSTEPAQTRRDAAWLSATLYDKAHDKTQANTAYAHYVNHYPEPLNRAMQARQRLSELAKARGDQAAWKHWLRQIIAADAAAGSQRDHQSRVLAANASLVFARDAAKQAKAIRLTQPLKQSLGRKTAALKQAIDNINKTLSYSVAQDTTAATYTLGSVYANFADALMHSQRPKLGGDALRQYNALLQQKAQPFVKQAVEAHKANLARISTGLYDNWIAKSVKALGKLAPQRYGKREKAEGVYVHLH